MHIAFRDKEGDLRFLEIEESEDPNVDIAENLIGVIQNQPAACRWVHDNTGIIPRQPVLAVFSH